MKYTVEQLKELAEFATGENVILAEEITDNRAVFEIEWEHDIYDRDTLEIRLHEPGTFTEYPDKDVLSVGLPGKTPFMVDPAEKLLGREFFFTNRLHITSPADFAAEMHAPDVEGIKKEHLLEYMLVDPSGHADEIFDELDVTDIKFDGEYLTFNVKGSVKNKKLLGNSAISAYWGDDQWLPSNLDEAVAELLLYSNDNPSPDEMHFEFDSAPLAIWFRADLIRQVPGVPEESFDMI